MLRNRYLTLVELLRNERRPTEELADLQNRMLQRLIRHAYERVPFYRERFDRLGIQPGDIRTAADLPDLPVVTFICGRYGRPKAVYVNPKSRSFAGL